MACLIHILCSDLLYIIGAPGTGKTFTAAQIIRAFLLQFNSHWYVPKDWKINQKFVFMKQQFPRISYHTEHIGFLHAQTPHHQIILTAHSNNATDQMAEALLKENFPLIKPFIYRLGSQSQSQIINQFTMEGYIQLFYQDLYRSNLIQQLRNPKLQDLKTVMEKNYHLFSNIICHFKSHHTLQQALLQKADIIVGTITGIQQQSPYLGKQSILIIEEAARVAEYNIASLVPLVPAKIIQIGDVLQLPPVIKDEKLSTNCGLQESLFHKQVQHEAPSILLNCQMRTTSQICDLYRDIYAVKLPLKLQQSLEDGIPNLQNSVFGYQVKGKYDNETNIEEVLKIKEIYDKLLQSYKPSQISVLSLYKKQIQLLNSHLQIKSFTVDEFQGLENDIIILSLANSFPSKFAQDLNRTLVAFSRGRLQLHVVGNISVYDNLIYQRFREIAEISK
ncbi:AAA domain-containing protein [Spironucleus salmonicida]|uniref:AAA domain-containing protein n=2 Tax=Spironucleus salmonicida TaxID=348837 RepID=A0A9P8S006_9EUKA|nr:AAA domain-containing protein [Spironucleus salmonicida]